MINKETAEHAALGEADNGEATRPAPSFHADLETLINRHSRENNSDTPDFILAELAARALDAFEVAINRRQQWRGKPDTSDISEQGEAFFAKAKLRMPERPGVGFGGSEPKMLDELKAEVERLKSRVSGLTADVERYRTSAAELGETVMRQREQLSAYKTVIRSLHD